MNHLHSSLRQLLALAALIGMGGVISLLSGVEGMTESDVYLYSTVGLLAIGLYSGTSTISLSEARRDLHTILVVITVGVVLKAAIVGSALAFIFQDPLFIVLAVAVAQIDPLSVTALMKDSHLSARARTALATWSAFDDPVTVVLTLSLVTGMGHSLAGEERTVEAFAGLEGLTGFSTSLSLNVVLVVFALALWSILRLVSRRFESPHSVAAGMVSVLVVGALAVWRSPMLGLAAAGLFMRPPSKSWKLWVERAVTVAFYAAAVMLGILLAEGINLAYGVALGVAAYVAQVMVGFFLTRRLPRADRVHLALSQQNGITSIILALTLEPTVPGVVAVIGPAVVTINLLHYIMGRLVNRRPRLFCIGPPHSTAASIPEQPAQAPGDELLEHRADRSHESGRRFVRNMALSCCALVRGRGGRG